MRKVRVINLDPHVRVPVVEGVTFEIVDGPWRKMNVHRPKAQVVSAIEQAVGESNVDQVIVGDYEGAGVKLAQIVTATVPASRVIVVWHYDNQGSELPYTKLGIRHFCTRAEVNQTVARVLAESA